MLCWAPSTGSHPARYGTRDLSTGAARVRDEIMRSAETAAMKVSPPLAVAAAGAAGMSLQDWVYAVTILYVVLQSGYLVWKWRREVRRSENAG